jgi:two-component system NarL family sensor kinase
MSNAEHRRPFADAFGLAVLRVMLVLIIAFGEETVDSTRLSRAFWPLVALAGVWATGILLVSSSGRRPTWLTPVETGVDFALLCALNLASGGAASQIRIAFFAVPLLGSFTLRPRFAALWSALAVGGYLAVSLVRPVPHSDGSEVGVTALYLAWVGIAATLLAWRLARRRDRIEQLAIHRGRLVAQALAAEERAHKQIAYELHDEPVQTLAAARVILSGHPAHEDPRLQKVDVAIVKTLENLRGLIFDLRPLAIEHGIAGALEEIAEYHSAHDRTTIDVQIDPAALGAHDDVVFALGRELLTNASKHARAHRIELRLTKQRPTLTLTVTDDGTGIPEGREQEALRHGHVGLAATRERVEALGGTLHIDTVPGTGTTVTTTLPTRRANDRATAAAGAASPYPQDRRALGAQPAS